MAFYKDMQHKTRREKQDEAFSRGGYEDEGSYSKYGHGKPPYGSKPAGAGKPTYGHKNDFADRNAYGKPAGAGKPAYGHNHDFADRNAYGKPAGAGKPAYGHKNDFAGGNAYGKPAGAGKPAYGHNHDFADRNAYGKPAGAGKPAYGHNHDFADRNAYGKPAGAGKPAYGHNHDFADRNAYGKPGFSGKPSFSSQVRPLPQAPQNHYEDFRYNAPVEPVVPPMPEDRPLPPENLLAGRNPIREAIKNGRDIEKLMVAKGDLSGSARQILAMARERHIPIQEVERARLDAILKNHQGMLAFASAFAYSTVEKIFALAAERNEAPFIIILDGITDPHNLGAIIRSAECAGAHGVIVQERRAVGLTPAAVKASAGAVEYLPVARVTNLNTLIKELKARDVWVYGADMSGKDYRTVEFTGGVALVIGAEGEGISQHLLENCDQRVALPMKGHIDSLNASVAAGILMYAVAQSRRS